MSVEGLERVREVLGRLFLGSVRIRNILLGKGLLCLVRGIPLRHVMVQTVRRTVGIGKACCYAPERMCCGSTPLVETQRRLSVHKIRVGTMRFSSGIHRECFETRCVRVSLPKWTTWASLTIRTGRRSVLDRVPQRRHNGARFLRGRRLPVEGAVLAVFDGVVEGAVVRSVLDKGSGDLLLWMQPQPGEGGMLVLTRRFGEGQGLSWHWVRRDQGGGGLPKRI